MQMKLSTFIRKFDIFGKRVFLNYKGDQKFRTPFGGVLGICFIIFIVTYSLIKFQAVWNDTVTSIVVETMPVSQDGVDDTLYFSDTDFKIAVGMSQDLPSSIGSISASMIKIIDGVKSEIQIPLVFCDRSDWPR